MGKRFTPQELFAVRNDIPVRDLISNVLKIPARQSDGVFRFQCPCCKEFHTATSAATNLARCFSCRRNFNSIDIVMATRGTDFVATVTFLKQLIKQTGEAKTACYTQERTGGLPYSVGEILKDIAFGRR